MLLCSIKSSYLEQRVHTWSPLPRNSEEMWVALQEEWELIEEGYVERLYQSMPERVVALIKAKGSHTRY